VGRRPPTSHVTGTYSYFSFTEPPLCHFAERLLASVAFKRLRMVPAAGDNRALPPLYIVGWFFLLPSLAYAGGSVVPEVCHLALAAARALFVVMREDAQNDSKHAAIADEPKVVGPPGQWPRYGVPALILHDGRSDSPAQ
jgi:hypothetical protein